MAGLPPRMGKMMWSSITVSEKEVIRRDVGMGLLRYVIRECTGREVGAGKAWLRRVAMVVLSWKGRWYTLR